MSPSATCRVCGSANVRQVGTVEYLQGALSPVSDCGACGCRFTPHERDAHQSFHAAPTISYYRDYAGLAERCRALFAAGDREGLRRELTGQAKYRFILECGDSWPQSASVLEMGCSRGYLTSWFILNRRNILGVDVSPDAIAAARAAFGDHFAVAASPESGRGMPYDVVYHVGMIGCVADPIGLTRDLLRMLKPGGTLLFNAPNRDALVDRGQLWFDSAPPPDLVTLFKPGFWQAQFAADAIVRESVHDRDRAQSVAAAARQLAGVVWQPPAAQPPSVRGHVWSQPDTGLGPLTARALAKAVRATGLDRYVAARPAEYGLFVEMTRK